MQTTIPIGERALYFHPNRFKGGGRAAIVVGLEEETQKHALTAYLDPLRGDQVTTGRATDTFQGVPAYTSADDVPNSAQAYLIPLEGGAARLDPVELDPAEIPALEWEDDDDEGMFTAPSGILGKDGEPRFEYLITMDEELYELSLSSDPEVSRHSGLSLIGAKEAAQKIEIECHHQLAANEADRRRPKPKGRQGGIDLGPGG